MQENSPQSIHFAKNFLGGQVPRPPLASMGRLRYTAAMWDSPTNLETPFLKSWIRHWIGVTEMNFEPHRLLNSGVTTVQSLNRWSKTDKKNVPFLPATATCMISLVARL